MLQSRIFSSRRAVGSMLALLIVAIAVATTTLSASASTAPFHLALRRAEPRVNDTIASSPASLKLWFSESIKAPVTSVRLTGTNENAVSLGTVHVDTTDRAPAVMAINETLKPGLYSVAWRTMSADGHPVAGTFTFTVRQPAQ